MTELLDSMNCMYYSFSNQSHSLMIPVHCIADGAHGPKQMS